jgi:Ni/Co efflux regulator RcnB
MKLSTLIAAGLVAVAAIAPAAASAQMQQTHERHDRVVTSTTTVQTDAGRHDEARGRGHRGWHGNRRSHVACTVQWRHHHRVRTCRTVRW